MITCFLCGGECKPNDLPNHVGRYINCLSCGVRSPVMNTDWGNISAEQWWQEMADKIVALKDRITELEMGEWDRSGWG